MQILKLNKIHKSFLLTFIVGLIVILYFGTNGAPNASAQASLLPTPFPSTSNSPYFITRAIQWANGISLDETIINGPSVPPHGFEAQRQSVQLPKTNRALGTSSLTVPAFNWSFGCSATSGSMIAAYYDRNGFPNMYTGPTNGSVMPLDSSSWPNWTDSYGSSYGQCPLTASHQGLDGRATRGSIDDYWVQYGSGAQDPFITNSLKEHTWGDAIGDYMKTSQSTYGNTDGSTTFYSWTDSTAPLTCSDMETYAITMDGTYGRKLFYEAKGYIVTDCYNQKTDNNGGGFTFAMYKAEIDAGRPVMLNLAGHTIVGIGYDDLTNTVYLHDTWDYAAHSMVWGTSYAGMALQAVSIVNLATPTCLTPSTPSLVSPTNGATTNDTTPAFDWSDSTNATVYDFLLDNDPDFLSPVINTTNVSASSYSSSKTLGNGTYYWKVRAHNTSGGCNVYSSWSSAWSFIVNNAPAAFSKSAPVNGTTNASGSPTLSWGSSSGATLYEYCVDTTNDNACSTWVSAASNTSVQLSSLANATTYYWQVRAWNGLSGPTYANGQAVFWHFTVSSCYSLTIITPPGTGSVTASLAPNCENGTKYTTGTSLQLTAHPQGPYVFINWGGDINSTNNPENLVLNGNKTISANFMYISRPFGKTMPSNGSVEVSLTPTLSWNLLPNAAHYEYCIDTTNDNACTNWMEAGANTSVKLKQLKENTTYYWNVRAMNENGIVNPDGNRPIFWNFTTLRTTNQRLIIFIPVIKR